MNSLCKLRINCMVAKNSEMLNTAPSIKCWERVYSIVCRCLVERLYDIALPSVQERLTEVLLEECGCDGLGEYQLWDNHGNFDQRVRRMLGCLIGAEVAESMQQIYYRHIKPELKDSLELASQSSFENHPDSICLAWFELDYPNPRIKLPILVEPCELTSGEYPIRLDVPKRADVILELPPEVRIEVDLSTELNEDDEDPGLIIE